MDYSLVINAARSFLIITQTFEVSNGVKQMQNWIANVPFLVFNDVQDILLHILLNVTQQIIFTSQKA